jgi:hypothetical protein
MLRSRASSRQRKVDSLLSSERQVQMNAFNELLAKRSGNGNKLKRGAIKDIITKYHNGQFYCVTRYNLEYRLRLYDMGVANLMSDGVPTLPTPVSTISPLNSFQSDDMSSLTHDNSHELLEVAENGTDNGTENSNDLHEVGENEAENAAEYAAENAAENGRERNGGRKKGSTIQAKIKNEQAVKLATTSIATKYLALKSSAKLSGKNVKRNSLNNIINDTANEFGLTPSSINSGTVKSRIMSSNPSGFAPQRISPLAEIEPLILQWVIKLAEMGQPLTKTGIISLANEIIDSTYHSDRLSNFKQKRKINNETQAGVRWYNGFLKRNAEYLRRSKCKIKDQNRINWCTYENFSNMYDGVYHSMVKAGVAIQTPEERMYDQNGVRVFDKSDMYGRPTKFQMIKPQNVVFVDETGCNTNQKTDGHIGGELFVLPSGSTDTGVKGACTDIHFSVLCFNNACGDAIMCSIILKSMKDIDKIPANVKLGIDRTIDLSNGESQLNIIEANLQNGVMKGGPTCTYRGKTIPCFIGCSPNASITSQMLAEMLMELDKSDIFDREDGSTPFLLLDGHHSRFGLPFLQYIHNDEHKWTCCIGVPYGTHIWQVADSSEMNGAFKIALTRFKRELLAIITGRTCRFVQTDIIPLVRKAWDASFAKSKSAKKAIAKRGWNPLNYRLLDHPNLLPSVDSTTEASATTPEASGSVSAAVSSRNLPDCDSNTMASINKKGTKFNQCLHQFILEEAKKEGRKRKLEEQQKEMENRDENFAALTTYTRIAATSGSLAKHNIYEIGAGLLAAVKEKEEIEAQKRQRISSKTVEREKKSSVKFQQAFEKYKTGKTLTREDLVALINRTKVTTDAANGKNMRELTTQWAERKHRLDDYINSSSEETGHRQDSDDLIFPSINEEKPDDETNYVM